MITSVFGGVASDRASEKLLGVLSSDVPGARVLPGDGIATLSVLTTGKGVLTPACRNWHSTRAGPLQFGQYGFCLFAVNASQQSSWNTWLQTIRHAHWPASN